MSGRSPITILAAWRAAVAVTARTYGVNPKILGAPRPARQGADPVYWTPRKVALYVTVLTADCTYAALARAIGLHKDTVTSQCEEIRRGAASSPLLERHTLVLEVRARREMAPELLEIMLDVDQGLTRLHDLMGVPETLEQIEKRRSIIARIRDITALGTGFPTENCGENLGELVTFRSREVTQALRRELPE